MEFDMQATGPPVLEVGGADRGAIALQPPAPGPELAIVVPTFNERENVAELVRRLDRALPGIAWEVVFVDDDSPDGTADLLRALARRDHRVRCLQRVGRRGLASACVEGVLATSAELVAVMDADLQHDETVLPQMLAAVRCGSADIAVGTRYAKGGSIGEWNQSRAQMSALATWLSHKVTGVNLSDPMSGFFLLRREAFNGVVRDLSGLGFKILLDILASGKGKLRVHEQPYQFRNRVAGESKLDTQALWDFFLLLIDKRIGKLVPARFVSFGLIGGFGVVVHFVVLTVLFQLMGQGFAWSQAIAASVAMVFNYTLNNMLTYRDRRRKGFRWITGLISFAAICAVGMAANVGVANYLFVQQTFWVFSALAGILLGAVWNYAVSAVYTWRK
jgi:dolichol-phosphate mannosyltransferase